MTEPYPSPTSADEFADKRVLVTGEQAASMAAAMAVRPHEIFALTCRIRTRRMITP
jgi:hypothetical protein